MQFFILWKEKLKPFKFFFAKFPFMLRTLGRKIDFGFRWGVEGEVPWVCSTGLGRIGWATMIGCHAANVSYDWSCTSPHIAACSPQKSQFTRTSSIFWQFKFSCFIGLNEQSPFHLSILSLHPTQHPASVGSRWLAPWRAAMSRCWIRRAPPNRPRSPGTRPSQGEMGGPASQSPGWKWVGGCEVIHP